MSLFGGQQGRKGPDLSSVLTFIAMGPQGLRRHQAQQKQQREADEERMLEDRLRAQLSPADTAQGSGTGAMPGLDQQLSTLNEARLLNPAVAERLTPFVQANFAQAQQQQRAQQAASLFPNDPRGQALWAMGNQSLFDSLGEQYAPQVVGRGGMQSVIGDNRHVTPPAAPTAIPFGWEVGPDGQLRPTPGGPADPEYIGRAAGVRRDAIVSRPTPSRARAGSAAPRASVSSRPRTNPWERDY